MSDAVDRINAVLGHRFRIEKELGSGGFATVYLAEDIRQRRKVAVKVLHPEVRGAVTADRFLREIEISAQLVHPNIVPVFESGEESEFLYFVMPYHGDSLYGRLARERQLPVADAIRIALEVADGLSYAHRQGIVHRDIKPSNILLSGGHALVADFGVARAISHSAHTSLTEKGIAVGTVAYMSPEQASGDELVDGRADIYGLGCVLYEMLAGVPPFRAVTPQAVMVRHMTEPPPSLEYSRPGIPASVDAVVRGALAKLPADRYTSVDEFQRALRAAMVKAEFGYAPPDPARIAGRRPARLSPVGRAALVTGVVAIAALVALAGRSWLSGLRPGLDPDQLVVFPLDDRAGGGIDGAEVALAVLNAIKFGEPLRPIDGWNHMTPAQRSNADLLNADTARSLSERVGAARFVQGRVLRSADSITVVLALYDTRGVAETARQSATASITEYSASHVGLQAARKLLPALIDPGRTIDISPVLDRNPTAIARWIEGEKHYRLSQFAAALDAYEQAIAEDSLLTFAALKGALAANWHDQPTRARRFLERAIAGIDALPGRYRHLALGLEHYATGRADSAVSRIRAALEVDPEWSEAWMMLGEVHRHLMPDGVLPGETDRAAFEEAARLDAGFSPPLIHLTEQALREGRLEDAARWQKRLNEAGADPDRMVELDVMHGCVRNGPERTDWRRLVTLTPGVVFNAAKLLSAGALQSACAKAAFRALLDQPELAGTYAWASMLGLQGVLIAEGRHSEASILIDSTALHARAALTWLMVDAVAGAPMQAQGERVRDALVEAFGSAYAGVGGRTRYLLGSWHAMRGEASQVVAIRDSLLVRAAAGQDALPNLFAQALSARIALLSNDTAQALATWSALRPVSPREALNYEFADALPAERLERARILLSRGHFDEAIAAAAIFDHAEPIVFLPFVPESLVIRIQAAQARRRRSEVKEYTDRLRILGRADLVVESS
ncbi:MAG: protein kinase domain-containing protein [Longimicrobiales bacterium]